MAWTWREALDGVVAAVFSSACPGCGEGGAGGRLCQSCLAVLPRLDLLSACAVCSEPFGVGAAGIERAGRRCGACLEGRAFARALALGRHEGMLQDLVHAFKFGGKRSLATGLGEIAAAALGEHIGSIDAVVPVPLGKRRARERGYNQAEAIARGAARVLEAPLEPRWLRRIRETGPQTELTRAQRRENVRGVFVAKAAARGKRVLLVDDVLTTGATLEEAARALRRAGAAEVVVLVLARASRDRPAADATVGLDVAAPVDGFR